MYRIRALNRFKRYLFHELRSGLDIEIASENAIKKVRDEIWVMLRADPKLSEMDRQEMWGDALYSLTEWQALLVDVPALVKEVETKKQDTALAAAKLEAQKVESGQHPKQSGGQ